jgi:hypothetical protein
MFAKSEAGYDEMDGGIRTDDNDMSGSRIQQNEVRMGAYKHDHKRSYSCKAARETLVLCGSL